MSSDKLGCWATLSWKAESAE
ncbi:unnamed protein product [Spirodela intermedia]|uniref:Uncharacterized protein n=1 Tax=Spirodela intermedia TaxID=51605 RepID=A0A7I8LKJ0_SPIIN|nr:unnamed protein product [Spirodela intermedia]